MADSLFSGFNSQPDPTDDQTQQSVTPVSEQAASKPGEPRFAPIPENNFKIADNVTLQMVEDVAGGARAHELRVGDAFIPGQFDTTHLRAIHAYVMQDIYATPGATRNDELLLAKLAAKNTPGTEVPEQYDSRLGASGQAITLLSADKVNARLDELGARLEKDNYLRGLEKPEFVERLATYHLEYTKASPFRAGNNHVLGYILNEVGNEAGYEVKSHKSTNLREVTDAILEAGITSDKTKLIQVFNSFTQPGIGADAELRRQPTLEALPQEVTPATKKRQVEEDVSQAGAKIVGRVGGIEGEKFRASMKAFIAGDPSPESINVARTTALKFAGHDLRTDAERIEKGAAYLDNYRRSEQQQGRQAEMGRVQPREQERTTKTEITQ